MSSSTNIFIRAALCLMLGWSAVVAPSASTDAAGISTRPEPSVTMTLRDYGFDLSSPLTSGRHVIRTLDDVVALRSAVVSTSSTTAEGSTTADGSTTSDGSTTTNFSDYLGANGTRTALQSAGEDEIVLWTEDAGVTVKGKLV